MVELVMNALLYCIKSAKQLPRVEDVELYLHEQMHGCRKRRSSSAFIAARSSNSDLHKKRA